ncbi:MAG: aminotransferase class IV, partial [Candidatus Omnitrophica bacterium]|nr:aminotransferase class IV [Candidatus Omnitrophota bacterium]
MGLLIYLDGQLLPEDQARVSVFDHGFLYGDGVFEGLRSYDGRIFCLEEHLRRLYFSAKAIMLEIPLSLEALRKAIIETVRANKLRDSYIRVVVTRGVGDLGLDPRKCPRPTVI